MGEGESKRGAGLSVQQENPSSVQRESGAGSWGKRRTTKWSRQGVRMASRAKAFQDWVGEQPEEEGDVHTVEHDHFVKSQVASRN